ncbi:DKNYY domain-containing protein, partial [bacterium]|nr:DKNYY domain-containing protein [bacterium]
DNQAHYSGLRTINNVDVSTFRILSNTIAYDKNFIYSAGLQAVANNGGNLRALFNGTWALDENVYRGTTLIPGVLASSFYSYNPNNAFFVSGNSVYYSSQNITNDFTNFKSLGGQYWQDSMKVGHASQVLPALRPNTVTVVGPHMTLLDGGGNNGVYYYGVGVAGALGGGNVQYLGGYFGGYSSTFWTDMRTVFATRNPVAGVRPDQIYFLPNGTATDGTRCYASDAAVIACPP